MCFPKMANLPPFSPISPILPFLLQIVPLLLGTVFSDNLYLKKQYGENENVVKEWGKTNCSLNGIDLTALGLTRPCEEWPELAPIYCDGKILEAVNYWGERTLFMRDSKHFVDRPLMKEAKKVVDEFKAIFNVTEWKKFVVSEMGQTDVDKLAKFVREHFGMADEALAPYVPDDWVESPQKFKEIKDGKLKHWAVELNQMWKEMSKKKHICKNGDQRHSLNDMANPFFVSGGRFRELRYWDAYWIARGLIASGMTKSVKNMCKNFAEMVNRFGYVPAGGRIYYGKRSQPPFLTFIVYDYFGATGDIEFLKEVMPALEKELAFWRTKRSIEVEVNGKKRTYFQYRADTKLPRPEAFCQDVDLVKDIADPMEKAKVWHEIESASESGWDFSSRWIGKDEKDKEKPWKLINLRTTKIVPVDLNALICGNLEMMAHLYLQIGDKAKSREYHAQYQRFLADFKSLFFKKEHGFWYDFNLESGTLNEAYYGSAAMPLFTRCYDTIDLGTAERMIGRMDQWDKDNKLISHPFGVPASNIDSSQQWDHLNIMPPLQHMLIEGLRKSGDKRMEAKAKELAQKWVSVNFKLYNNSQICGSKLWEKITADAGTPGKGGEYPVQMDFGWTIGALLDLLVTYGQELELNEEQKQFKLANDLVHEVNVEQKVIESEPFQFPNELSDYRAKRLAMAQKKVDQINRSQKFWKAVIYEPFAMLTEEELKMLNGVPTFDDGKVRPANAIQLKSMGGKNILERDNSDLPEEFDARTKWPECADIISTIIDQGLCGCCWAVSAASALTDRICIARLKKGQKTDKNDPRAYISAQHTCEFTPGSHGCNGSHPIQAWQFFQHETVSGTNYAMYGGCKPWTIDPILPTFWDALEEGIPKYALGYYDASWKTKRPTCNRECRKAWVRSQYPGEKAVPFSDEMSKTPTVVDPIRWLYYPGIEQEIMREIMVNGSITASYKVYDDFATTMAEDTNQIYARSPYGETTKRSHAIKIIGWGQQKRGDQMVKYWLIVNSRGKGWGMDGLFKMRRGVNECDIESDICFGTPKI